MILPTLSKQLHGTFILPGLRPKLVRGLFLVCFFHTSQSVYEQITLALPSRYIPHALLPLFLATKALTSASQAHVTSGPLSPFCLHLLSLPLLGSCHPGLPSGCSSDPQPTPARRPWHCHPFGLEFSPPGLQRAGALIPSDLHFNITSSVGPP